MLHGLLCGMVSVTGIVSVVAQFVEQNLVGREIAARLWKTPYEFVLSQEEHRLAELAAVVPIFGIAVGAHREDDLQRGIDLKQFLHHGCKYLHHLLLRGPPLREETVRLPLAVGDHHERYLFPMLLGRVRREITHVGAQRHYQVVGPAQCLPQCLVAHAEFLAQCLRCRCLHAGVGPPAPPLPVGRKDGKVHLRSM